ncbi:uncharacterized protein L969DRAFT_94313 [Mixia osmundae IAM 14324]|uniref:tRNA-guanosine(34) queuine transglycosylase n=1 Tax=Mixia osmundae (strain CBS 9802 / IAM 14324 / JCM 22182 / KY 12970) TaxID=764103 RepID=G7DZU2_MIXOS|nr:uncharacterized protein L969DRAFT_94313 [Mixia osmundae IAM 14324]KEI39238.1 hypothetical protein L969DRAFT_94313 [Mixia osmundae IAM 14324]GAA96102.1 hypothetical protein E5Q_02763 [Mixia osmundae IAM 14324]
MPVATQACMKGLTAQQVESLGITLLLNNTYHLGLRPGTATLDSAGGAHRFQGWQRNMLTDSGGFQMVSLAKLQTTTEQGVEFENPFKPGERELLTPEESMRIQHSIGADIMMQLDDVIASTTTGPRMEEAMLRSVRWLDRCIQAHKGHEAKQNLFAIVQGGLDAQLRDHCLTEMLKRADDLPGYAVGGLSGGEEKGIFWQIVSQCAQRLPADKPRYVMGVGYSEDLLVCVALGMDMADCVFPTRTARFGIALTFDGPMNLRLKHYENDDRVIDESCPCPTCDSGKGLKRSVLWMISRGKETVGAHVVTLHNLMYQRRLLLQAREAIIKGRYPEYLRTFFRRYYVTHSRYPAWAVAALRSVGVDLMSDAPPDVEPAKDPAVTWDPIEVDALKT